MKLVGKKVEAKQETSETPTHPAPPPTPARCTELFPSARQQLETEGRVRQLRESIRDTSSNALGAAALLRFEVGLESWTIFLPCFPGLYWFARQHLPKPGDRAGEQKEIPPRHAKPLPAVLQRHSRCWEKHRTPGGIPAKRSNLSALPGTGKPGGKRSPEELEARRIVSKENFHIPKNWQLNTTVKKTESSTRAQILKCW